MAERRMFSKQIIDSDAFLDMPSSTQSLYFHLGMRGDDEGFVNNPKKIQRMIGSSDDDMRILTAKNFIIPFESGVCVIKHWKIHNYIRGDRLQSTVYQEERSKITLKNNNVYSLSDKCQSSVSQMSEQVSIGKVSIVEDSIVTCANIDDGFEEFYNAYPKKKSKIDAKKAWLKHKPNIDLVLKALAWQIESDSWQEKDGKFIPYPASYINAGGWMDEPTNEGVPF
jgi:hypothetical protein